MQSVVLVATHDTRLNQAGQEVPMPLVDVGGEPYLTTLVKRLALIPGLETVRVVVNEAIREAVEDWHADLQPSPVPVTVLSDGTWTKAEMKGAIGDLLFAMEQHQIDDDLLIVGGDNWFTYDLGDFVSKAEKASPAVVVVQIEQGARATRFGWVELGEDQKILKFHEHPPSEVGTATWKASCVYYLDRDNLKWVSTYANDHTPICSPGTFFAWLVEQIPVHGIPEQSFLDQGNEGATQRLAGADYLEWRDIVRNAANPDYSTWERQAARQLSHASSHTELLETLKSPEVNLRIISARLLGQAKHLLTDAAVETVTASLLEALADAGQNDIADDFECDDDSAFFVSATAAESLVALGYAEDVTAVYAKAKHAGVSTFECRNMP